MANFPSPEDIRVANETLARAAAIRAWLGKSNSYHPSELPDHINPPSNQLLSHAERVRFFTEPLKLGASYVGYLSQDKQRITTWTGETLANVTAIGSHRNSRGWLTNERGSFWARGIDGRLYHGRHNGTGMYCRMRLSKEQR